MIQTIGLIAAASVFVLGWAYASAGRDEQTRGERLRGMIACEAALTAIVGVVLAVMQ